MFQMPDRLNRMLESEYNSPNIRISKHLNTSSNGFAMSITTETTTETIVTAILPPEGRDKGMGVISAYIQRALCKARFEQFDDGSYYAEIPECPGVWANEESPEQCKSILAEALEDWILLKLQDGDPLPDIDGVRLRMEEASCAP